MHPLSGTRLINNNNSTQHPPKNGKVFDFFVSTIPGITIYILSVITVVGIQCRVGSRVSINTTGD
jgi:hypothetical protein